MLLGASAKETPRLEGIEYVQVIHPSAAMRFTKMREKFKVQIAQLAKLIAKTDANRKKVERQDATIFGRNASSFKGFHHAFGAFAILHG